MLRQRLGDKPMRTVFLLSALVLEAAWVMTLCVGALKLYEWAT